VENIKSPGHKTTKWIRWTARVIGTLIVAFWVLMGLGYAFSDTEEWTWESAVITVLIITSAVGLIIAWWREGIGGTILVVTGVAFGVFAYITAGHNKAFAVLVSGLPFFVIGLMFLVSWQRAKILRVSENKK